MLLAATGRVPKADSILLVGVQGAKGWCTDSDHKVYYDEDRLIACLRNAGVAHVKSIFTPLWRLEHLSQSVR